MKATIYALYEDRERKGKYCAMIEISNISFESVQVLSLEGWSKEIGMPINKLKKLIKR